MPHNLIRTVICEAHSDRRESLAQLLASRPGSVSALGDPAQALEELRTGSVDLLLVPASDLAAEELFQEAEAGGLEVCLLFEPSRPAGWRYLGRCRFGSHKWVFQLLESCGAWWELRRSESEPYDRYRKLLNRVGDGVVEVDPQDRIRWSNATLRAALGNRELVGLRLEELVDPADAGGLRTLRQQHGAGVVVPFPIRLANGQLVELDPNPRYSRTGQNLGTSIVFRGVGRQGQDLSRGRELFALYSVATAISQAIGLEEALKAVVTRIPEMLGLSGAGVFLTEEAGLVLRGVHGVDPDAETLAVLEAFCASVPEGKKALVLRGLRSEQGQVRRLLERGFNGVAAVPLRRSGEQLGVLWFVAVEEGHFSREVVSLLVSAGAQTAVAVQNARHVESQLEEEAERRRFYRDALQAVTRGKLILCERPELEDVWDRSGEVLGRLEVNSKADVPRARVLVEEALGSCGVTAERCHDMALCTTEAVGNVVKHADHGAVEIRVNEQAIRIRVEDDGPGIHFAHLPKAVLSAGFSTAPSLGMGYSILLELADVLHLTTGEGGTIVLLELATREPDPLAAFAHLLDD